MSEQEPIPIPVAAPGSHLRADTTRAILRQVHHALRKLMDSGEATQIDLRAQPFGPGELERLVAWLGRGEVSAAVEAMGPTRVWESALAGVWLIDHRNGDDQRLTLQIEVAPFPEILCTPSADLPEAIATLAAHLNGEAAEELD